MKKVDLEKLPTHIAFILDGNGRWATKRHMPRTLGHKKGVEVIKKIVNYCFDLGIKCVTLFAFSTENWKRPKEEVDEIFNLLRGYIDDENRNKLETKSNPAIERGIKIRTMGNLSALPDDLQKSITDAEQNTANCDKFILNIAINYGGRDEIVRACNSLLSEGKKVVTEQDFNGKLYSCGLPDLDFIIRTAGDIRLSNFMLYQCAYSELYFTDVLWPDFNEKHLNKALISFSKRNRKFGSLK